MQVRVQVPSARRNSKVNCTNPNPESPGSLEEVFEGFVMYLDQQRSLGALRLSSFTGRRLSLTLSENPLVDCYHRCYYDAGMKPEFYFAVNNNICYCSQEEG